MVLVAMPEPGDSAELLAGRQGRLLDSILTAFGFTRLMSKASIISGGMVGISSGTPVRITAPMPEGASGSGGNRSRSARAS